MKLPKKQISNVRSYCDLNNIEDIDGFILQCFIDGYNIKKYGLIGDTTDSKIIEKEVEKIIEVVKEVEVPVEVVKEVEVPVEVVKEVRVEVPIEKIVEVIKEVPGPTKEVEVIKYVDRKVPTEKIVTNIVNNCDKIVEEYDTKINELKGSFKKEREEFLEKLKLSEEKTILNSSNNQKKLQETLSKLRKDLSEKNDKINKLNKIIKESENNTKPVGAVYLKGSNLNN